MDAASSPVPAARRREHDTEDLRTKLLEAEHRLKELEEVAGIGYVDWDLSSGELLLSDEAIRIYGLDESRGRAVQLEDLTSMLHPDDASVVKRSLENAVHGLARHDMEHRMIRPDGRVIYVHATAELRHGEQGRPKRLFGVIQDISALQAESNLRERLERRLDQAQRLALLGAWEIDLLTGAVWWSEETSRILGGDAARAPPSREALISAVHPEDRERVEQLLDATIRAGVGTEAECRCRILAPDGGHHHVRSKMRVLQDRYGVYLAGMIQDVSDTVRSRERLREAQRVAQIGNWELNLRTQELSWSDEIFRIFEIDPTRFGASYAAFLEAVHPDDRKAVDEAYQRSVSERRPYEIQHRLLMADGRIKHVNERCETYYDNDGDPLRSIGTVQDITSLQAAIAAKEKSEKLFESVFEESPIGMVLIDSGRVVKINGAYATLLGRSIPELHHAAITRLGGAETSVVASSDQDSAGYLDDLMAGRRDGYRVERQYLRPDGEVVWADVSARVIRSRLGQRLGIVIQALDITARKRAEEETGSLLAEKELLLREIHHRVRNNLQVISGLVHFQARKLKAPEDQTTLMELRNRIFAMTLLHERLYQSRDLSRIAFGDYVRSLVAELVRSASRSDVHIEVLSEELQLPVELAMPCGLIIIELVTNILKYAFPAGLKGFGSVSIAKDGDHHLSIEVSDQGVGFPPSFDPAVGSGFGWELIRGLADQLRGTVAVVPGAGAKVRFSCSLKE